MKAFMLLLIIWGEPYRVNTGMESDVCIQRSERIAEYMQEGIAVVCMPEPPITNKPVGITPSTEEDV